MSDRDAVTGDARTGDVQVEVAADGEVVQDGEGVAAAVHGGAVVHHVQLCTDTHTCGMRLTLRSKAHSTPSIQAYCGLVTLHVALGPTVIRPLAMRPPVFAALSAATEQQGRHSAPPS